MTTMVIIALCIMSALAGAGLATGWVWRQTAHLVARMRKEGYIMDPEPIDKPQEYAPWRDVPE